MPDEDCGYDGRQARRAAERSYDDAIRVLSAAKEREEAAYKALEETWRSGLPYDAQKKVSAGWHSAVELRDAAREAYEDAAERLHKTPLACPACGSISFHLLAEGGIAGNWECRRCHRKWVQTLVGLEPMKSPR